MLSFGNEIFGKLNFALGGSTTGGGNNGSSPGVTATAGSMFATDEVVALTESVGPDETVVVPVPTSDDISMTIALESALTVTTGSGGTVDVALIDTFDW